MLHWRRSDITCVLETPLVEKPKQGGDPGNTHGGVMRQTWMGWIRPLCTIRKEKIPLKSHFSQAPTHEGATGYRWLWAANHSTLAQWISSCWGAISQLQVGEAWWWHHHWAPQGQTEASPDTAGLPASSHLGRDSFSPITLSSSDSERYRLKLPVRVQWSSRQEDGREGIHCVLNKTSKHIPFV